mmetsp:Transcript_8219/g.21023  ORF Transcript_8219/g.21023 Transcript_8219/m.21023 type:complete len:772 (+) Transcript_8219:100-2415(+)
MGNHQTIVGHSLNNLGLTNVLGADASLQVVLRMHDIEPWCAMDLVRENLKRQGDLAQRSPLRFLNIDEVLPYIIKRMKDGPPLALQKCHLHCCKLSIFPTHRGSLETCFDAHPGKNTLARQDAGSMPMHSLEACMQECRRMGCGAIVVWRNKCFFKGKSVVACRRGLFDDKDATTYLNLVPEAGDWEMHNEMNTLPRSIAHQMAASDLDICKQECTRRGDGAFMVWRGMAFFKNQSVLACREGLVDEHEAVTYLHVGPKVQRWHLGEAFSEVGLNKEDFVKYCHELLEQKGVKCQPRERMELYDVFNSMDFDCSGNLSTGEWAGGLSVFLQGDLETSVRAVFSAIDTNHDGALSKAELREYLKPFVQAMSPPRAEPLRPILLKKVTDDVYDEMDLDRANDINDSEMLEWMKKSNNVVMRLADIVDGIVRQGQWRTSKDKTGTGAGPPSGPSINGPGGGPLGWQQGGRGMPPWQAAAPGMGPPPGWQGPGRGVRGGPPGYGSGFSGYDRGPPGYGGPPGYAGPPGYEHWDDPGYDDHDGQPGAGFGGMLRKVGSALGMKNRGAAYGPNGWSPINEHPGSGGQDGPNAGGLWQSWFGTSEGSDGGGGGPGPPGFMGPGGGGAGGQHPGDPYGPASGWHAPWQRHPDAPNGYSGGGCGGACGGGCAGGIHAHVGWGLHGGDHGQQMPGGCGGVGPCLGGSPPRANGGMMSKSSNEQPLGAAGAAAHFGGGRSGSSPAPSGSGSGDRTHSAHKRVPPPPDDPRAGGTSGPPNGGK